MDSSFDHVLPRLASQAGEMFRGMLRQCTLRIFPLRDHLRGYSRHRFMADARAALQVAMLDLPQGMAYASLAGLPLQYGTMSSAVSSLAGAVFGSSRYNMLGPTNATAFMLFSYFAVHQSTPPLVLMPVLVLLTGLLLMAGSLLRVAELTQYVSRSVIVAYVTGAAVLIIANQLPHVLGMVLAAPLSGGSSFLSSTLPGIVWRVLICVCETKAAALATAALTLGLYALLRYLRPAWPALAITLVLVSTLHTHLPPTWRSPTYADAIFGLKDLLPLQVDFTAPLLVSWFNDMFGLALAVSFLATLESVSMSKTLSSPSGERVDVNQDMLALGFGNVACAFLAGMPCSGSLTRSALNHQSGAHTPLAALINGLLCLSGALTLGRLVGFIPKPALAALIIAVAVSVFRPRNILVCLTATGSDALTFVTTLAATLLLPLHVAIFVGVGLSLLLYLRKASRPSLVEYEFNRDGHLAEASSASSRRHPAISIIHVEGDLFFGAADLFLARVAAACADPLMRVLILRLKNARHMDATSILALENLLKSLRDQQRHLLLSGLTKDMYRVLRDSGLADIIGRENLFHASSSTPNVSTHNALQRAQLVLGITGAEARQLSPCP
jgi:SulP family sulfate permease